MPPEQTITLAVTDTEVDGVLYRLTLEVSAETVRAASGGGVILYSMPRVKIEKVPA